MCEGRPDRIRIRPTSRDPTMDPAWRIEFDPAHHAAFEIIQPARERHVADRAPQIASPDRFQADLPASSATASCCGGFQRLCEDTASGNTAIPNPPHAAFVACVAQAWCCTREDRQDQPIFARNKGSSPSLARYPGLTMNGPCRWRSMTPHGQGASSRLPDAPHRAPYARGRATGGAAFLSRRPDNTAQTMTVVRNPGQVRCDNMSCRGDRRHSASGKNGNSCDRT